MGGSRWKNDNKVRGEQLVKSYDYCIDEFGFGTSIAGELLAKTNATRKG